MQVIDVPTVTLDDSDLDSWFLLYTLSCLCGFIQSNMHLHLRCYTPALESVKRFFHTRRIFEYEVEDHSNSLSTIKVCIFYFTKQEQILLLQCTKTRRFLSHWRHLPIDKTQRLISYFFAGSQHMVSHEDTVHVGFLFSQLAKEFEYQLLRLFVLTSSYENDGLTYVVVPRVEQLYFIFPEPYVPTSYRIDRTTNQIITP